MADDIDRANDQAQQMLDYQLRARKRSLMPRGACYNCDDPLSEGAFCCVECRDDYEKMQRAKERNGN